MKTSETHLKTFYRKKINTLLILLIVTATHALAQTGEVKGRVSDVVTNEPLPFVNIGIQGTGFGGSSDMDGNFSVKNIPPGTYNITVTMVGFEPQTKEEVVISNTRPVVVNFELQALAQNLKEVVVSDNRFEKSAMSPLSKFSVRSAEILRNPGGNRDISKVLQSFPGVGSTVSFRNDILIRGGAPNENRFYLDGVEVPNINHFATQGSSGGPVGMINVNFINEVEFYSGAFPANRGNTLSSVMEFRQKSGNPDRLAGNVMLGSSDVGLTADGPLGKNADFIFSVRRSYLQLLFSALKLPFLPTYNDAQYKATVRLDKKNTLTFIGLGALDQFSLNTKVNNGLTDSALIERNAYILGNIPSNNQWSYTSGVKYTHFSSHSAQNIIVSRNSLNNDAKKYANNDESNPANLILDYASRESENHFRFEDNISEGVWRIQYGVNVVNSVYTNNTYNRLFLPSGLRTVKVDSRLNVNRAGAYAQVSRTFFRERLNLSAGLRSDMNDYSAEMSNALNQISPRFSASLRLSEKMYANFNTGRYYQLPAYTVLGYRDSLQELTNKKNGLKYIACDHVVGGLEYRPDLNTKISVESFHKNYFHYPFLVEQKISLANLGGDFGVIGNDPVQSRSNGRSYGFEVLVQRSIKKGVYGILAYTFVKSEFTNGSSTYTPSSWDNRHILTLTAGKQFKHNWEAGFKFRYFGGAPYTPYDVYSSSLKSVWDVTGQGVMDYTRINSMRLPAYHSLDLRVDKKIYVKKLALNIYLDIQNLYGRKLMLPEYLTVVRDNAGMPVTNPNDPNRYLLKRIKNESGTVIPSVGMMFDF